MFVDDGGLYVLDFGSGEDAVEDEAPERRGVRDSDVEKVVIRSGDVEQAECLREVEHCFGEAFDSATLGVFVAGRDQRLQGAGDAAQVDVSVVAADDPVAFESADPGQAARLRESDAGGEHLVRDPRILLERGQDLVVNRVNLRLDRHLIELPAQYRSTSCRNMRPDRNFDVMNSSTTQGFTRPRIVGIVNITEDSFSDGGRYLDPEDALAHARRLRSQGADIIELGPASSHPDAAPVTVTEERRRLTLVLKALTAEGLAVSVDSMRPETQHLAIAYGAAYLNDIQGFPNPDIYPALATSDCQLIVMHSIQRRGIATRARTNPCHHLGAHRALLRQSDRRTRGGGYPARAARRRPGARLLPGRQPRTLRRGAGRHRSTS